MGKGKVKWDAESIGALRRHLGLTQQVLAAEMGVRQQTISEWETGVYKPRGVSIKLLIIIAGRYNFEYNAATRGSSF